MLFVIRAIVLILALLPLASEPAEAAVKYCANYKSTNTPDLVSPGQTFTAQVSVRNCGTLTWDLKDPNRVFLSYHWYQGTKLVEWDVTRVSLPQPIALGKTARFQVSVKAPLAAGDHTLRWDLVHVDQNNVENWFSKNGAKTEDDLLTVWAPMLVKILPFKPTIKSVYYYQDIRPGQRSLIFGLWFENSVGQVKMRFPSGKIETLVVRNWFSSVIEFEVPSITGETDGQAAIWVQTAKGQASNTYSLPFRASRQILLEESQQSIVKCGSGLFATDNCVVNTFVSILGDHRTLCCFDGDDDTDSYTFKNPLKNGWVFDRYVLTWWGVFNSHYDLFSKRCIADCPHVEASLSSGGKGSTQIEFEANWDTGVSDRGVLYYVDIYISGPKGVPYF